MNRVAFRLAVSAGIIAISLSAGVSAQSAPKAKQPAPAVATPTAAPAISTQALQLPPAEAILIMIRTSLVSLSQANTTNNYGVFWGLAASEFRARNTPQSLSALFLPYRTNNISLDPVVVLNPQLVEAPRIEQNHLRVKGFFPSKPLRVEFDISYAADNGRWLLSDINIALPNG